MQKSHTIIGDYLALCPQEQLAFLRRFNQNLDAELCDFLLCIARDPAQEEALRKEAMNVIGLFSGKDHENTVKKSLFHLLRSRESDDIKQHVINTLALMKADDSDILLVVHLVQDNGGQGVKQAALAFIARHSALPSAKEALQRLTGNHASHPSLPSLQQE